MGDSPALSLNLRPARPRSPAHQELAQTANEVNILGVLAVGFFILVPGAGGGGQRAARAGSDAPAALLLCLLPSSPCLFLRCFTVSFLLILYIKSDSEKNVSGGRVACTLLRRAASRPRGGAQPPAE